MTNEKRQKLEERISDLKNKYMTNEKRQKLEERISDLQSKHDRAIEEGKEKTAQSIAKKIVKMGEYKIA